MRGVIVLAVCCLVGALPDRASCQASRGESESALERMPRALETRFALSALPPALRDRAAVDVLDPATGYVLERDLCSYRRSLCLPTTR